MNLNVKTVFVDIDGTLTDPKPEFLNTTSVDPFSAILSEKRGISLDDAQSLIMEKVDQLDRLTDKIFPYGIENELGVDLKELWDAYSADYAKRLFMHSDAKEFLSGLKPNHPEIKVYTATTNPRLIIFAKLAVAGLADINGSPYLDDAFGGEEVSEGGKLGPDFFRALLRRTGADPDTTLMVGDHPKYDLEFAKAAGIKHIAIASRDQNEDWIEKDGGIHLKRLDTILSRL
jgi:FMN phosphatase YigB (HAD superfamily)